MVTSGQQWVLDGLAAVAGMMYLWVAATLYRRPLEGPSLGAMRGFITWWGGLGSLILVNLVWKRSHLAAASDVLAAAYTTILLLVLVVSMGGLLYYLLFIYTGKRQLIYGVVAFYAVFTILLAVFMSMQDPYVGADPETGVVGLQYHHPLPPDHPLGITISAALLLPPVAAAGAYILLFRKVSERASRFRILMVAGGIVLWFGYNALSSAVRLAEGVTDRSFGSAVIAQFLGIVSAGMVLLAYRPPRVLERWLQQGRVDHGEAAEIGIRREASRALPQRALTDTA